MRTDHADRCIDWLELADLLHAPPCPVRRPEATRGHWSRTAVGPATLLLDEPLANLDHSASQQCLGYLQRLTQELNCPCCT